MKLFKKITPDFISKEQATEMIVIRKENDSTAN